MLVPEGVRSIVMGMGTIHGLFGNIGNGCTHGELDEARKGLKGKPGPGCWRSLGRDQESIWANYPHDLTNTEQQAQGSRD